MSAQNNEEKSSNRSPVRSPHIFRRLLDRRVVSQGLPEAIQTENSGSEHPSLSSLNAGTVNSQMSPISPEFDSITELPSPVVSLVDAGRSPTMNNKSYGSLAIRPSSSSKAEQSARIISEYQPSALNFNQMNRRFTNSGNTIVNMRTRNGSFDTGLRPILAQDLKRETGETENKLDDQIIFKGYDLDNHQRQWKYVKDLGKGNFSVVKLGKLVGEDNSDRHDPLLEYVAVKVVEIPTQKDTRSRVIKSLEREIELLKIIRHPSIIKLLALNENLSTDSNFLIISNYCKGGDLFELASAHSNELPSHLMRRIFAELAVAVCYLHQHNIVHRDIKLENVLVNFKYHDLLSMKQFGNTPIITLTDFGLSRTIDPENPLLTTRCGSEDYVSPELLIGLPYDGRQSDSWAMGVLLYTLLEGRLPFDIPPNRSIRSRSRPAHRIARVEWVWVRYNDESKGVTWNDNDEWDEAKKIVACLLIRREKRSSSLEVARTPFVTEVLTDEFMQF